MESKPCALDRLDEHAALRAILEGTASATGDAFFRALVQNLAGALHTYGAWVTEYVEERRSLRALAFWMGGEWLDDWEGKIDGTPCQVVIEEARLVHCTDNVTEYYAADPDLVELGAVSYMGVPLLDVAGRVLGHLAVLDTRPMPEDSRAVALIRIFAARAAAELQRIRAELAVRAREAQLAQLVDSAMDAIFQLDRNLTVTLANPAAERLFGKQSTQLIGQPFDRLVTTSSYRQLLSLVEQLHGEPQGRRHIWIPSGLRAFGPDGREFPAEATVSRFELWCEAGYTVILRNTNERTEAERRIQTLTAEREYLREELKALHNFDEIIGRSEPLLRVLRDVERVARTDASVLIHGETGTGKELIARAIHAASGRRDRPLIRVNCAAIPAALMESEFFGHEKGAFTGATAKREGRFALADGGTIFLDEIGELSTDLQAKLLRVLQEGEFEPVGSSRTRKVDVRIVTATNKDLSHEVKGGRFREDLYYRLSVFPIALPPLRERPDDIALLAEAFARRCAQRMGRTLDPLSETCKRRLAAYDWPGNVRELQNVIERAVIISDGSRIDLDRALPCADVARETTAMDPHDGRVLTLEELQDLERSNLVRALETAGWRVSGQTGAASLLGMNPSTLNSRIKALGISRPQT